ncbi:MAG: hypothetical protein ACLFNU_06750 [Bacteroidales bacterium]
MKKLALTNTEVIKLRELYQNELKKAFEKVEHLTAVLNKLDAEMEVNELLSEDTPSKPPSKKGVATKKSVSKPPKKSVKQTKPAEVKKEDSSKPKSKRGRKAGVKKSIKGAAGAKKIKWNDVVLDTIKSKGIPMLSSTITEEVFKTLKAKQSDKGRVKNTVSGTLSKLVTAENKLKTYKLEGSRNKLYGLPQWFNEKGELLPEFN